MKKSTNVELIKLWMLTTGLWLLVILSISNYGCTPKIITKTITKTDTLRIESIKEVTVLKTVIDTTAIDSLFNELRELQLRPVTSDTRIIYKERERLIKEQIIKEVLPDSTWYIVIPFKMASPDSTYNAELKITIDFRDGIITHTATSEPVKMPYTSSSYSVSVQRLNAWSKWVGIGLILFFLGWIAKKVIF